MYQDKGNDGSLEREKNNVALLEWQRIQQLMRNSIPVCKGHKEPCVARIVKKPGPTFGHRFFVCSRAEVFSLNLQIQLINDTCTSNYAFGTL